MLPYSVNIKNLLDIKHCAKEHRIKGKKRKLKKHLRKGFYHKRTK